MFTIQNFDAQAALGFVLSQTTYIESQVNEQVYPDVQYPFLVPVDTSAPDFVKTITFYSGDMFGKAQWINGNADDIPIAGSNLMKFESSVFTAGIGYAYGWEELGQAMWMGVQLEANDAKAARRAYEEFMDVVALYGDARKGFTSGLLNSTVVTAAAVPNGDWSTATDAEIIADINAIIGFTWSGTAFTSIADTLLLPFLKFDLLSSRVLAGTNVNLLSFIKANNTYTASTERPLTIRGVRGLETAGALGVTRMVAYRRSPDVVKLHQPMPHQFLRPYQAGPLRIEIPGVFRTGGTDIRRPKEIRYGDGI